MQGLPVHCHSCVHLFKKPNACKAFPQGIPAEIITWAAPHSEPTPTQKNEIVWEFKPGKETELEDWKSLQNAGRTK